MMGLPRKEITAGEYFFLEGNMLEKSPSFSTVLLPDEIDEWLVEINRARQ